MANVLFSFNELNMGVIPDKLSSSNKHFDGFDGVYREKQSSFYGAEDWGEAGGIDAYGFYGNDPVQEEGLTFSKCLVDGLNFNAASPPIQTCLEEIAKLGEIPNGKQDAGEVKKENMYPFSLASLGLLNNYGSGFKRLNGDRVTDREVDDITMFTREAARKLSTEEIMRVAGEMFIKSSCQTVDSISMFDHPFNLSFSGLSDEETKDVQLAVLLLAAAEKVGYQQYERASRLLKQCDYMSSKIGNPVQRVVYHLSEALREKIEREAGRHSVKGLRKPFFNLEEAMMSPSPVTIACYEELPFCQIIQFAGVQAIIENVTKAKRIHIIDLGIKNGLQWTILLQALSSQDDRPLELLKVTAVATTTKHDIEATGLRLSNFAKSLSIPFSFNIVMVSDMLELKEDLLQLEAEETIVVYAAFIFRSMLAMPNRIENIMRVLRVINPCLMVVSEVEANHNSPIFVNRFIEVLFFFSAYFDCVANCMKPDCKNREIIEMVFFGEAIKNIIAAEGEERKIRHVNFDVWRAFFVRYGMEEAELSMSSRYQADLLLKNFPCGSCCTLHMNGKCLLIGWKGTPMHSVSVWKFL